MLRSRLARVLGLTLGALVLLYGASIVTTGPRPALACSPGPDYDPIAESEIIVGGYITDWRPRHDLIDPQMLPGFVPVEIELRVDHTWKGSYDGGHIIAGNSYREEVISNTGELWRHWGGGGSCGALGGDPRGLYAVFGLSRDESGNWSPYLPTTFYLDRAPYDPAQVTAYGRPLSLPAAGNHQPKSGDGWLLTSIALASAAALAMVTLSAAWMRRRRGHRAPGT